LYEQLAPKVRDAQFLLFSFFFFGQLVELGYDRMFPFFSFFSFFFSFSSFLWEERCGSGKTD